MRLALEPEAAALFTKEQNICRQEKDGNVELVPFTPGSTLMVIDLGGKKWKSEKLCIYPSCVYLYISKGINVIITFCVVGIVSKNMVFFSKWSSVFFSN